MTQLLTFSRMDTFKTFLICETCGKNFKTPPCRIRVGRRFCSNECKRNYPIEKRFWPKVAKGDGCWIWTGAKEKGYGTIRVNKKAKKASRISWELSFGQIPNGLFVCHKCDNPSCVRPNHLFLGTCAQNHADRNAKGRQAKGSRIGPSKFTEEQIIEMRSLRKSGMKLRELGERFGINMQYASKICRGGQWKHVK